MRPLRVLLLPLVGLLALAAESPTDLPAVARPRFTVDGREAGSGTAFFLRSAGDAGAVAVAAAHSFDFAELARSASVEFRLGRSKRRVAVSSRFHAEPGRPFSAPGATLRDDYVVFALDSPPYGVRLLEAAAELPEPGDRVRLFGVPAAIPRDEDDVFARVREASETRLELELDVPLDLRGWGGAPVLDEKLRVVGLLEAAWPEGKGLRVGVAPIAGVVAAIGRPLDGGLGAPFARYADHAPAPATPRLAWPEPATPIPQPDADKDRAAQPAPTDEATALAGPPSGPRPAPGETLLGRAGAVGMHVQLEIEFPPDGSVIGDAEGAFVAGRALALQGEFRRFDLILVIDTSGSANQMSGADINANGVIGHDRLGGLLGGTDAGDSILAAEVAAARQVLGGLDPRSTRVALVSFAGEPPQPGGLFSRAPRPAALTEEPLTAEFARIEQALDRVAARGAEGLTHMAAGIDQATIELLGLRGALSEPDPGSEKVVLFFTDGQPTLPYDAIFESDNVKAVLRAADRAARAGIKIHSFAIGPEALEGPIASVEMAERTQGYFTPVREPGDLASVIENVSFANLEGLALRNLRSGAEATQLVTNADGSWSALVALEPGRNPIEVTARATDGSQVRAQVTLHYAPGAPELLTPRPLLARRTQILEQRLVELKRARIESEREAAEQTRRELVLEIEKERDEARQRAAHQRKELDLEAERGEPQPDGDPGSVE